MECMGDVDKSTPQECQYILFLFRISIIKFWLKHAFTNITHLLKRVV